MTDDEPTRSAWTLRRNRLLLVSSVAMNTAVLSTVYLYATRRRERR